MNCEGFVYLWYDRGRKMFYLGSHIGSEKDYYICSSKHMIKEYRRRPSDFKRRILERCSSIDILQKEQSWLNLIKVEELYYHNRRYYNVKRFAAGGDTLSHHPDRTNIIKSRYGKKHSDAIKKAINNRPDIVKALHRERQTNSLLRTLSRKTDWYQAKSTNVYRNGEFFKSYSTISELAKDLKLERSTISKRIQAGIWYVKQQRKHPFNVGDIITFS